MAEKRNSKRKIKRLPVTFSSNGLEFNGYTSNLSFTGMFVRTRKPFKPGAQVKVSIQVDKNFTVSLTGISVRAINLGHAFSKNGMGIQLLSQSEIYNNLLRDLF
jgi:Tfp pilus assembly protein PilZ